MADLRQFLQQSYSLTEEAMEDLLSITTVKAYRKGQYLLRKDHICQHLYFVNSGLIKNFFRSSGGEKEFIGRFFGESVLFSVFESYIPQTPSKFVLCALEPTTVTLIPHDAFEKLCAKHHCVETMYRKLLSIATLKMTRRISEMLEADAAARYHQFVADSPDTMQRLSLGEIAKYLGITQQSLSRIRATPNLPYGKKSPAKARVPLSKKQRKNGNDNKMDD